jgi:hypothetical protein
MTFGCPLASFLNVLSELGTTYVSFLELGESVELVNGKSHVSSLVQRLYSSFPDPSRRVTPVEDDIAWPWTIQTLRCWKDNTTENTSVF